MTIAKTTREMLLRMGIILFLGSTCLAVHAESIKQGQGTPQQQLEESIDDLEKYMESVNKDFETLFDLSKEDMVPSIIESKFQVVLAKTRNLLAKLDDGERLSLNLTKLGQLIDSEIKKIGENPSSQTMANNLKSLQKNQKALEKLRGDLVKERELATVEFNKLLGVEAEVISSIKVGAIGEAVSKAEAIPIKIKEVTIALGKVAESAVSISQEFLRATIPQQ